MKFLVIRFSSIGDIVLTTPVLRCLKKTYPDAQVHYLTKKVFHPLLAGNPYIDEFHLIDHKLAEVLPALKEQKFDYIIDLHKNLRSLRTIYSLDAKTISFDKINMEKWLKVNLKVDMLPQKHIVDRYFDALEEIGVTNDGQGLDYYLWNSEIYSGREPALMTYIAFVIGATHNTKKLPEDRILAICEGITGKVVLLGGKAEASLGDRINQALPAKVVNMAGKLNINESANMVKYARKIITHDTGLMHIAAAYQKPIISIWGNTIPDFGMYPYFGEKNKNVEERSHRMEVKTLPCRPCSKLGYTKCPRGHFLCMEDQDIQRVVTIANEI
ncbi:MAG: glycosyltransferase family 9 protein [Bacteroidota bacterium]|nr:glycosyltransferase family 9 protein [Bacteroidota bacterium]